MFPESIDWRSPRIILAALLLLALLLVPPVSLGLNQSFYLSFATRVVIFAIAATGLNLVLGYGGLVSMGHSLYIGLGAYVVGISAFHGLTNGWAQLLIALALASAVAIVTGAVSLRTRSIGFIMITLAFGQMFFFIAVSLKQYGGDDGLPIDTRSDFGSMLNLDSKATLYYVAFAVLVLCMYFVWRMMNGRFGYVIRGFQSNERRMLAAGFPRLRYQLTAYVLSALMCTVAGMLLANLASFSSPSYLSWQASGDLLLMVVMGGMGTVIGPLLGAVVLLGLEEILSSYTQYWLAVIGILVLIVAVLSNQGLWGALLRRDRRAASSAASKAAGAREPLAPAAHTQEGRA